MSKMTLEEVKRCRLLYSQGAVSRKIWEKDFKDRMSYSGFQRMWHGKSWKEVMPEVFNNNPHPRQHITDKDIKDIREKAKTMKAYTIYNKYYRGKIGYASIYDIIHYKNRFELK